MKKLLIIVSLLMIVFVTAGCLDGIGMPNSRGYVYGIVYDSSTGNPIPYAQVNINGYTVTAEHTGNFRIDGVPQGERYIHVYIEGYSEYSQQIQVQSGGNFVEIFLTPMATGTGAISGIVYDNNTSERLANVVVDLDGMTALTNAVGEFAFYNVPEGEHTILISVPGYAQYRNVVYVSATLTTYVYPYLFPGTTNYTVSGHVYDSNGNTVSGAYVEIFAPATYEYYYTYSNTDGSYGFDVTLNPSTSYKINVEHPSTGQVTERWMHSTSGVYDLYTWIGNFTPYTVDLESPLISWPAFTVKPVTYMVTVYRVAEDNSDNRMRIATYTTQDLWAPTTEFDAGGYYIVEYALLDNTNAGDTIGYVYSDFRTPASTDFLDTMENTVAYFQTNFNNDYFYEIENLFSENYNDGLGNDKSSILSQIFADIQAGKNIVFGAMEVYETYPNQSGYIWVNYSVMDPNGNQWTERTSFQFQYEYGMLKIINSNYSLHTIVY